MTVLLFEYSSQHVPCIYIVLDVSDYAVVITPRVYLCVDCLLLLPNCFQ